MNEDKILSILSNVDDDLIEKEIDNLMDGVECDMEAISKKAKKKLEKYNGKSRRKIRLPLIAAACACLICVNIVYADEISEAIKSFFNKTPVYSTMVDGSAYYLKDSLELDDRIIIESLMVSEGRLEAEFKSKVEIDVLKNMKIVPKNDAGTKYVMGGYSEEGDRFAFSFMNEKEQNYNIRPFKAFSLIVGEKTYLVNLEQAKSLDAAQKLSAGEAVSDRIDIVEVGANSVEIDGKRAVQLIASFKNKDMKLSRFGKPIGTTVKDTFENLGKDGTISSGGGLKTEDIYATDENGTKYKLEVPADAKARPITTFVTGAPKDSKLNLKLPALLASYEKTVDNFKFSIPKDGEEIINRDIDMIAQKALVKSVKRLSPTTALLEFRLNTGTEKNISIRSFHVYSESIKKISSEFADDKAIMTLEFDKDLDTADLNISWPMFVFNGNWTISMK